VVNDLEIFSTAELVLGNCTELQFDRIFDQETGYNELTVSKAQN
jgi:predicted DNA-binding protein with PD1-like motif